MYQTALVVDTDAGLHAEVPLVALLRLRHLRIAFTVLVLGRGRGGNQSGVDGGAFLEQQPFLGKQGVDFGKQPGGQPVGLKQVTEVENGGLVGQGVAAGVEPGEAPQQRDVV